MSAIDDPGSIRRILPAVFLISFAAIGWQLALMRCLLITRYHHFSFLIISCALLGFGAGGTVLSVWRPWFERQRNAVLQWGTPAFALSMPLCFRVGELLPVNVYFPPSQLAASVGWWVLFWLIHLVPFLIAGVLIGLALTTAGPAVHKIYATNLLGSAAGALGGIVLLDRFPANGVVVPLALAVIVSGIPLVMGRKPGAGLGYYIALAASAAALASAYIVGPDRSFPLVVDQYKPLAYVRDLVHQGSAKPVAAYHGLRGRVEVFASPYFHTLMSLGTAVRAPTMDLILRDGFQIGSILRIRDLGEAKFLQSTLFALPYKLVQPATVLVLGDAGGMHIWLARLSSARVIVVVQPDPNVLRILRSDAGRVLDDPRIRVVATESRSFLDKNTDTFDIIQLAALEGFSAGSSGIGGLREDYLATVQGFAKCFDALAPDGMTCVVRGIQDPERDNIRIAATWIEAMETRHISDPGNRILIARDELALATLAGRSAFRRSEVEQFREVCRSGSYDVEWLPGVRGEQTNRIHVLPGPEGATVSWYYEAVKKILSPDRENFYNHWICQVRPATDDKPFFNDFFRLASVAKLKEVFGPLWATRSEMGFLVLLVSLTWTAVVSLFLLPSAVFLPGWRSVSVDGRVLVLTVVYFAALGAGFMSVEMNLIQMFTRFLGDPILSVAVVTGVLLLFAGLGSMSQPVLTRQVPGGILTLVGAIGGIALTYGLLFPNVFEMAAGLALAWKSLAAAALIAPVGFLMGVPFPWGLSALQGRAASAVPLAWAVNGFASVVSTSAAVILAMTYGFKTVAGVAAGLYWLAGFVALWLGKPSGHFMLDRSQSK
jgi:hypothetical protein